MKTSDLTTPCFLVDINKVRNNVSQMQKNCKYLGVSLRPHTKTHKTIELAEIQTGPKKRGITVSTLKEAEAYADAGFDDILLAHPITQDKIKRSIALIERLEKFHVMISDENGLRCLQENQHLLAKGRRWSIVIEIDSGYKRSGFVFESGEEIQRVVGSVYESMELIALYCHCGSSYDLTSAKDRAKDHQIVTNCLQKIKNRIREFFPQAPDFIIGTGSTPACSLFSECHKDLDEFHPGNYVFFDIEQYHLNACRMSDIACKVMTRVIAHKPEENMIILDCGFLGLSLHGHHHAPGPFGVFEGEDNLKIIDMSQELGKVKAKTGDLDCRFYPVGTILYILPYHSCATAAMYQEYYAHNGEDVIGTWKAIKGW